MNDKTIVLYKGKAKYLQEYCDVLETKYYGWKLIDAVNDMKRIKNDD